MVCYVLQSWVCTLVGFETFFGHTTIKKYVTEASWDYLYTNKKGTENDEDTCGIKVWSLGVNVRLAI